MKTKTIAVACAAILCAGACLARPGGPGPRGGGFHRPPPPVHHGGFHRPPPPMRHGWHHPPHHRHHCHGGYWGPAFVGGVIGGAIASTVVEHETVVVQPTTTVVQQPVVVQPTAVVQQPVQQTQSVWVEGRYVDQVQADGTTVRVWQPGHFEQQAVVVQ